MGGESDKANISEMLRGQKEKLSGEAKVMSENLSKLSPEKSLSDEERKAEKEHHSEQYGKLMGAGSNWRKKKEEERDNEGL